MTKREDAAVEQHGEGADGLAPQLVETAAVEQPVDAGRSCRGGQEADGQGAPEAADEVDAHHVERVVEAELVLQCRSPARRTRRRARRG